MKIAGCALMAVGAALLAASLVFFGTIVKRAMDAREVAKVPVEAGGSFRTDLLPVATDKQCQVAVRIHPEGTIPGNVDMETLKTRYPFSLAYRVFDGAGKEVFSQSLPAGLSGMTTFHQSPQALWIEKSYAKFPVTSSPVRLEAEFTPDFKGAKARAELKLYDTVSDHTGATVGGVLLLLAGPAVGVAGLLLLIFAFVRKPKA
jgi:hypothetical protein